MTQPFSTRRTAAMRRLRLWFREIAVAVALTAAALLYFAVAQPREHDQRIRPPFASAEQPARR